MSCPIGNQLLGGTLEDLMYSIGYDLHCISSHRPLCSLYYLTHRQAAGLCYQVAYAGQHWAVVSVHLLWRV